MKATLTCQGSARLVLLMYGETEFEDAWLSHVPDSDEQQTQLVLRRCTYQREGPYQRAVTAELEEVK